MDRTFRLPTLGQFLNWAVSACGGLTKHHDPNGALRKAVTRLAKEEDIDPSSFERILHAVQNTADALTSRYENHWLSGRMWRDAFSAYQYLTVSVAIENRDPAECGRVLFEEILSWFSRSLYVWLQQPVDLPGPYREHKLWFVDDGAAGDGRQTEGG